MLLFVFSLLFASQPSLAQNYEAKAFLDDGSFWYVEKGVSSGEGTKVLFLDSKNKEIAHFFFSPAEKHKYVPDTEFLDQRDGYRYSLKFNDKDQNIEVQRQDSPKDPSESKNLPFQKNLLSLQGVPAYLQDHATELRDGKDLKVDYIIPSRLTTYTVVLRKDSDKPQTKDEVWVTISADSTFLKMLMPSTAFKYSFKENRILEFQGNSCLLDDKDRTQRVKIRYSYLPNG